MQGAERAYCVYIVGNDRPTLYVGVTNDLVRRVYEHRTGMIPGFTQEYGLKKLLYYEAFSDIREAITREKRLKHWNREWKLELIRKSNPEFNDLYSTII